MAQEKHCMIEECVDLGVALHELTGNYDSMSGRLLDVASNFMLLAERYGETARLTERYEYPEYTYIIKYYRPETAEEAARRARRREANERAAQTRKLKKEQAEREQLVRLMEKYGT